MGRLRSAAAIGALALVAVACGSNSTTPSSSGSSTPPPTSSQTTEPINNKGTKDVSALTKFGIEASNDGSTLYFFEPTFLKAKPGQKVTVTLENKGTVDHNFSIAALNINQDLNKGAKAVTITFTLPASGSVEFHCEYHHASGMRGYFYFGSSPPQASGGSGTGGTATGTTTY